MLIYCHLSINKVIVERDILGKVVKFETQGFSFTDRQKWSLLGLPAILPEITKSCTFFVAWRNEGHRRLAIKLCYATFLFARLMLKLNNPLVTAWLNAVRLISAAVQRQKHKNKKPCLPRQKVNISFTVSETALRLCMKLMYFLFIFYEGSVFFSVVLIVLFIYFTLKYF